MAGSFFDEDFNETKASKPQGFARPMAPDGIKTAPVGRPSTSMQPVKPMVPANPGKDPGAMDFNPEYTKPPLGTPPLGLQPQDQPPQPPPVDTNPEFTKPPLDAPPPPVDRIQAQASTPSAPPPDFLARLAAGLQPRPMLSPPVSVPGDTLPPTLARGGAAPLPMPPGYMARQRQQRLTKRRGTGGVMSPVTR